MAPILSFRANRLAFPGGNPGVNPAHPASRGLRGMVIPQGKAGGVSPNAINIAGSAGFRVGITGGGDSCSVDSALGPAFTVSGAGGTAQFTAPSLPSPTPVGTGYTMAVFARSFNVAGANNSFISLDATNIDGAYLRLATTFSFRAGGAFTLDSGIAGINGVPYFYAFSGIYRGSNLWDHFHVVRRLDTGGITSASVIGTAGAAVVISDSSSFYYVNPPGSGGTSNMACGPAMVSTGTLSLLQLLKWADDPWAFWYPQKFDLAEAIQTPPSLAAGGGSDTSRGRAIIFQSKPNKLAYPGTNMLPGVNQSHIAGAPLLSTVGVQSGNCVNLQSGVVGAINGVITGTVLPIGPVVSIPATINTFVGFPAPTNLIKNFTIAAIFQISGYNASTFNGILQSSTASSGSNTGVYLTVDNSNDFSAGFYGGTNFTSGLVVSPNVPYFGVASVINTSSTNYTVYYTLVNLRTGQVQTTTITSTSATANVGNGTYNIGNLGGGALGLNGFLAALAFTPTPLNLRQQALWAQDPWSFWYPQRIDLADLLSTPIVTAVGLSAPGLLQTRSVPGLGPQSRHTALLNASLPAPAAVVTVTGGTLPIMGVG